MLMHSELAQPVPAFRILALFGNAEQSRELLDGLHDMADCYQNRYIVYYAQDRSRGTLNRLILTETMTTV